MRNRKCNRKKKAKVLLLLAVVMLIAAGCSGEKETRSQDTITDEAIRRFLDSGDISEFVAIGMDGAEKMADKGLLDCSADGQRFTAEGLDVMFDAEGRLFSVTATEEPYNLYGAGIGDSFDIFNDGKQFTGNGMALVYEDADAVVYAVTDDQAAGGDRAATITLEDSKVSMILFEMSGGASYAELYSDIEMADETMDMDSEQTEELFAEEEVSQEESDISAAAVGSYLPGMRIDGIYVYDNGIDAVCTADVNLGQGYISIECTGYGGHGLYAYEAWDCQENDTGDYTVSDDLLSCIVTFTDGGLYIAKAGEDGSSMSSYLEGYYYLTEPYDPSIIAGLDFPNSYIIPDSDKRLLTQEDLSHIGTTAFLRYAKNEIYARHGRQFASADLDAYFNSKNWYTGTIAPEQFDESVLSEIEKENVNFIQEYIDSWY